MRVRDQDGPAGLEGHGGQALLGGGAARDARVLDQQHAAADVAFGAGRPGCRGFEGDASQLEGARLAPRGGRHRNLHADAVGRQDGAIAQQLGHRAALQGALRPAEECGQGRIGDLDAVLGVEERNADRTLPEAHPELPVQRAQPAVAPVQRLDQPVDQDGRQQDVDPTLQVLQEGQGVGVGAQLADRVVAERDPQAAEHDVDEGREDAGTDSPLEFHGSNGTGRPLG